MMLISLNGQYLTKYYQILTNAILLIRIWSIGLTDRSSLSKTDKLSTQQDGKLKLYIKFHQYSRQLWKQSELHSVQPEDTAEIESESDSHRSDHRLRDYVHLFNLLLQEELEFNLQQQADHPVARWSRSWIVQQFGQLSVFILQISASRISLQ